MTPSKIEERYEKIATAWELLRPTKKFAGLTLAEFQAKIAASRDKRKRLSELDNERTAVASERDQVDGATLAVCEFVVNSIKGDPDEGADGTLYEACGYVRKSERKSGLSRLATLSRKAAVANSADKAA